LPATLAAIVAWARDQDFAVEILVVENGSSDATAAVAREMAAATPSVRVVAGLPKGKGAAVRAGMLAARGRLRFLCDADLSMPIAQVERFIGPTLDAGAVAVGSREAPGARRFQEPAIRHLMGRVFNRIVRYLVVPGVEDTQCGFKMFSDSAAEEVFGRSVLSGWGFDAEALFIARRRGYDIVEVPIDWHFNRDSRVDPWRDPLAMVRELVAVRYNALRGAYDG